MRKLLEAARQTAATQPGKQLFRKTDIAWLEGPLASVAAAWRAEFGAVRDASGLQAERNIFRYAPVPVTIRYEAPISVMGWQNCCA
ncbi:MAG TPA: hypothetical protein VHH13_03965 [Arthrobacter sp.]|nr:hypothetical protein [Arthrobacter sp.]